MKQSLILLFTCLSLFFSTFLFSQDTIMVWGEYPKEDLEMTVYPKDSQANAVVLGEVVSVTLQNVGNQISYVYNYHTRIKVLTKAGAEQANIDILFKRGKRKEYLQHFKAQTVNYKNGEENISTLSYTNIYEEELNSRYFLKKFSFPNVQPGSIIEYQYEKIAYRYSSIEDHYFQREDIPVRKSQFSVDIPSFYEYSIISHNIDSFDYHYSIPSLKIFEGYRPLKVVNHTWAKSDIPRLKEEIFISSMQDYFISMSFQIRKVKDWYGNDRVDLSTWRSLKLQFEASDIYGKAISKRSNIKKMVQAHEHILDADKSKKEKMKALYSSILNKTDWNEDYHFYPFQSPNELLESGKGSSADIHVALLALLKAADIEAYPALVSTRDHGQMFPDYPVEDQFNNMIIQVVIDGKTYWLDALNDKRPLGLLGLNSLNRQAWVLKGEEGVWETIKAAPAKETIIVEATIDESGALTGNMSSVYENYSAVIMRMKIEKDSEEEYINDRLLEDYPGSTLENLTFKNKDIVEKRLQEKFDFRIDEAADAVGDMIYFSPMLHHGYKENIFKIEERTYPIDLATPQSERYILNLNIPEGYSLESIPKPLSLKFEDNGCSFQYLVSQPSPNKIQVVSNVKINRTYFGVDEYQYLKDFFDSIVEKHTLPLVIKKDKS